MFSPFTSKQAGFYQDLLKGVLSYPQLGNRLIRLAEQAHIFRQFDKVKEYGLLLANMPLKPYQALGHYFLGVAANSKGNGDQDEARKLFEIVTDTAHDPLKAKAILSLAAVASNVKDYQSQLSYLLESAKAAKDVTTKVKAHLGIAIYKSREGFHQQSLGDLENLYMLARHSQPIVFFDYLNSLAVELGEAGRKDEARNVIGHVLASPFIHAYPEWRETAEDLRPPRRSFVALSSAQYNILLLPEREPSGQPSVELNPARVFNFAKLKQKIVKEKQDKNLARQLDHMSTRDLGFKLLEIITQYRPAKRQLRAIVDFALHLLSYPTDPDKPAS